MSARVHERGIHRDLDARIAYHEDQLVTLAIVEARYPHLIASCRYYKASVFYFLGLFHLTQGKTKKARIYFGNAMKQNIRGTWKAPFGWLVTFLPDKLQSAILTRKRPRSIY